MTLPLMLHENQVRVFNFYRNNAIYQGMTYQGTLFKRLKTFPHEQRLKAFERAWDLSSKTRTVVTVDAENCYRLWVDVCAEVTTEPVTHIPDLDSIPDLPKPSALLADSTLLPMGRCSVSELGEFS